MNENLNHNIVFLQMEALGEASFVDLIANVIFDSILNVSKIGQNFVWVVRIEDHKIRKQNKMQFMLSEQNGNSI